MSLSAFALVKLALHLYGAPSRATVPGDLVISNHRRMRSQSVLGAGEPRGLLHLTVDEGACCWGTAMSR